MSARAVTLDRVFSALADPTRIDLVERLSRGSASVSDLAEPLDMTLPSLLKHLRVLEEGGLVRSEKRGRVRTYRLEPRALDAIDRWVERRRTLWNAHFDRLERLLADEDEDKLSRRKSS